MLRGESAGAVPLAADELPVEVEPAAGLALGDEPDDSPVDSRLVEVGLALVVLVPVEAVDVSDVLPHPHIRLAIKTRPRPRKLLFIVTSEND